MNLYQCQNKAKEVGFDRAKFLAVFPSGPVMCQWIDAYFGFFKIDKDGLRDGFVTVQMIDKQFPDLQCSDPYIEDEE